MAISHKLQLRAKTDGALLWTGTWRLVEDTTAISWQSLDLIMQCDFSIDNGQSINRPDDVQVFRNHASGGDQHVSFSAKALAFLLQCVHATLASGPGNGCLTYPGHAVVSSDWDDLTSLFSAASAGLIYTASSVENERLSLAAAQELEDRLSFPWIISEPAQDRTLVLVDANSAHPAKGGGIPGLYLAAKALGIKLVVLDNGDHWLEEPDYAYRCEAFVPTRLTNPPEENLTGTLLNPMKQYGKHVDGIITFADSYWTYFAEAAKHIGIPTASVDALKTATNKYLTSKFVGHEAYRASSLVEAHEIASKVDLPYPLIVKPCDSWSSEGVFRVNTSEELTKAIEGIDKTRHGSEFVMERYCPGPEVDANFILLDGEVLFFEVCDDLPKSADVNGPTLGSLNNFHELNSVYPSALPTSEINLLRESFLNTLLEMGLRNGIMHLEGRVDHSCVDYELHDSILDLRAQYPAPSQAASAWLIEINPRPLGMTGSHIIESTYGIDYWGLTLLIAVQDKSRVRALSHPFKNGPQYHCVMVFIPAEYDPSCEGLFDLDDICIDLKARRKDLARNISRSGCLIKRGQKVPHPSTGVHSFLAYFNVFSRKSREEALRLAEIVREEVRYSFR